MAAHAEYSLRRPGISEVFNLSLAVPTPEASCAEGLIACQDSKVLNLIATSTTAVGTVVANQRAIAEEEEVRIGVEESVASIASKAVEMPSVSGCDTVSKRSRAVLCVWNAWFYVARKSGEHRARERRRNISWGRQKRVAGVSGLVA